LPASCDAALSHPPTIAAAVGAQPAAKVGGQCRKKAPARLVSDDDDDDDFGSDSDKRKLKGRPVGAGNYLLLDVTMLLDSVEKVLPLGNIEWKKVHSRFTLMALKKKRPVRDASSLEKKFKKVCYLLSLALDFTLIPVKACRCSKANRFG
jgi:hypothetical protein